MMIIFFTFNSLALQYYLINLELRQKVKVSPISVHVSLGHPLHTKLLQGVSYIIKGVLVWDGIQNLDNGKKQLCFLFKGKRT